LYIRAEFTIFRGTQIVVYGKQPKVDVLKNYSTSKAESMLKWRAGILLAEGLECTVTFFLARVDKQ